MQFLPRLQPAKLIKRYKRFLADATTPEGQLITLHCANTGAMTGCAEPESTIWYSTSDNAKRKYPFSWQLTQTANDDWICINTHLANAVVKEALEQQRIPELAGYDTLRAEVKYGHENSRIDFLQQSPSRPDCYIEVKSVTLLGEHQRGFFPDAKTERGQKHLRELTQLAQNGDRAVLFFLIMHSGIENVSPAKHIDEKYTALFEDAIKQGVEVITYNTAITPDSIRLEEKSVIF